MIVSDHGKKKIAPLVITILVIIYYAVYFGILITIVPFKLKILLGIIPAVFAVVMVSVCVQRMKEIDGGEEDDLSKY